MIKLYSVFANPRELLELPALPPAFRPRKQAITVRLPPQSRAPPKQPFNFHRDSCKKRGRKRERRFQPPPPWMGNAPRIIKKKKNGSVDKSLERREKTQAAKYQAESRKGRREKKKKAKKSLEYRWKTLFFSPAFSNYTKEMPTPIVHPIFNLARCTHTHTDP